MAEKKTGKKFVQKPKFRNEKKYKTDKTEVKKYNTFGKKKAEKKIVVKSEKSLCPVHGKCGGCQLLDMPYEEQLKQKQKQVNKLLKPYCNTEKIIGMENPFHYRNKVHAVFGHRKDGTVISGIYQQGTHFIVPVDECLIEDKRADAIIRDIRDLLKSFKIKTYNEDTGYGLFRHVLVRTGHHSGQVMVVLVLGSPILPSKNNFVIFGTKEAGKTVLLDKILYDILNVVTGANLIPVLLDFNSIENDITINIRKYWKKNTNETNDLLLNDNIVLLIDNINFEIENINQIQNLSNFLKKFPKTRFIATSLQLYENNFSITPEQQSLLQFERLELKQFKAKQIKTLIQKWFPNSPQYETPKKMNTLINAFMSLNLPRTPFAVSMFLWIIERQQTYRPQNNATLIEKFIEEILDKKNIKGILRDTFDYENKIWLLAEIAHKMLISDQPNYSLPCSDIIKITERHLALRKFPKSYSARKIINGILNLGVFVEEDSVIRFRFNCFFEYFLVKKMETDPEFKKEVLDENNYLKYCNEINYYTGLHRGEAEILKNVVDRLEFDYITINDIVFSKVKSIDDFFHIDKSIVEQIKSEELFELLPDKKTEEESEKESDTKLEHSSDKKEGIIKKKHTNKFIAFGQLMLLAMNVLKNSEEIHEENLKADSYTRILKNSISYVVLYKMICEEIINHFEEFPKERVEEFKFVLRFLPVIHQNLISDNLGTYKLAEVIKEKIEADKVSGNKAVISEFEKFLSVYLYCDIKGDGYKAIMGDFIKNINKTYIADSCFFKLLAYYYSSTTPSDDNSIVNLLADLYIKVNANKNSNKRINKSALIQKFKKEKAELE